MERLIALGAVGALGIAGEDTRAVAGDVAREVSDVVSRDVTWLVDNADAYVALLAACRTARESVWISQLAFDADCVAYLPDDAAASSDESSEMRLADVLLDAMTERAVEVRVLLNASLLLDTATPLREHFARAGASAERLRIRGVSRFPQLLHAKIVIVDSELAFLVGSPFANGYWDDSHHQPIDLRRPERELGGRPLHDLSVQLRGAAVAQLAVLFTEWWNGADDIAPDDHEDLAFSPALEPARDTGLRIVTSAPRPRWPHHPRERTEILKALLEGIRGARTLLYIEHQYLSSVPVITALAAALESQPALEVLVVLNQNPDVTAYRGWQNRRLAEHGLFDHPRVGLFSLWTAARAGSPESPLRVNQLFVHSKVVIADDRWAMVGSANLDGVSLHSYGEDFSGRPGQRVFRDVRNFDVAAILDGTGPQTTGTRASILELRTALWREHLDCPDLDAAAIPADGWLAHWRRVAESNGAVLRERRLDVGEQRLLVLPYSRQNRPAAQLAEAGVHFARKEGVLCFDPSWVEVHLSPNWFRNMFA